MMRAVTTRIVMIAFLLGLGHQVRAHVALDYPLGGEAFIVGETITIQWHIVAVHATLNWDLYFSVDSGETWDTLQLDIPTSQLSYEWEVPDSLTAHARIRVIQDNEAQNYQDQSMDFTIVPNISPPILDAPASDTLIECNLQDQQAAIQAWLSNHGGAAVTNYCGNLIWTHDYPGISNACGGSGSVEVTFLATDNCGQAMTIATVTIADTSPPVIAVYATDVLIESDGQGNTGDLDAWLNNNGGAQAVDACSDVIWTNTYIGLSDDCGLTGSASVTFTVSDQCGNSATTAAVFTIGDHVPPAMLMEAQPLTITCDATNQENEIQQWLNSHGGAQATDIGGEVTWTNNYSNLSDSCGSTGYATIVFTAADACGNMSTTNAVLKIEDHTPPTIQVPAQDAILECDASTQQSAIQLWVDSHAGAQATDGCGEVIWSSDYTSLSDSCGLTGDAIVVFTATDQCGNNSTTAATIVINDMVGPFIEVEARDTTMVCGQIDQAAAIKDWLDRQGGAIASDQCGSVVWTNDLQSLADTCGPVGIHYILFTASDQCGNAASTQAILTIVDSLVTSIPGVDPFDFKVYPNPARDVIHVALHQDTPGPAQLVLFDRLGQRVWTGLAGSDKLIIPVESLSRGAYLLKLITSRGSYTRHVLIL